VTVSDEREAVNVLNFFLDAFGSEITRRALIGGMLAATTTSLIGTWVVIRGLAFFGDAMAHGVLPGIALAAVWGFNLTIGAAASALVMVLGINLVHRTTKLSDDTGIGLLFVGMLALGVVIISKQNSFAGDLTGFLFGDVLGVRTGELVLGAAALVVTVVGVVVGHRSFLALSINAEKAATLGLRPGLAHVAMLVLLSLTVVASFRVVGTLLVFGLLVAPPATAVLLVRRVPVAMIVAVGFGWIAVVLGLAISYHADTAASATVAGVAVVQFFAVLIATEAVRAINRRRRSRAVLSLNDAAATAPT
jgi:ABC-type Mn2+/Zn2+ transport system permease subunit